MAMVCPVCSRDALLPEESLSGVWVCQACGARAASPEVVEPERCTDASPVQPLEAESAHAAVDEPASVPVPVPDASAPALTRYTCAIVLGTNALVAICGSFGACFGATHHLNAWIFGWNSTFEQIITSWFGRFGAAIVATVGPADGWLGGAWYGAVIGILLGLILGPLVGIVLAVRGKYDHLARRSTYLATGALACVDAAVLAFTVPWTFGSLAGEIERLEGHDDGVACVAVSPDGQMILSGSLDKSARLWDWEKGRQVVALPGARKAVLGVAFSPDGTKAASAALDGELRLFETSSGKTIDEYEPGKGTGCGAVAFSPDGKLILVASGWMELKHNVDSEKGTHGVSCNFAVGLFRPRSIGWVVSLDGKHAEAVASYEEAITAMVFSPDGRFILTAGKNARSDWIVDLWELRAGNRFGTGARHIRTYSGHRDIIWGLAFAQDGKRFVSGSWDGSVRVWDVETGDELMRGDVPSGGIYGVAFAPDGRRVLSAGGDKRVRLWDASNGKELCRLYGHRYGVSAVAFLPDGRRAVSASWDGTVRIWQLPR